MKLHFNFWDIIVGLPAGVLIFMSTMMFGALLRRASGYPALLDLAILAADAAIVGGLIRLSRPHWAISTAIAAGVFAGGILLYLRLSAQAGDAFNPLLFGLPGILLSIIVPPLTAYILRRKPTPTNP